MSTHSETLEQLTSSEGEQLAAILNIRCGAHLGTRRFHIKTSKSPDDSATEVLVTLANSDRTYVHEVLARMDSQKQGLSQRQAALHMLDYVEAFFDEHLTEKDVYLPIDFQSAQWGGYEFFIKGQVFNRYLEDLADQLMAQHPPQIEAQMPCADEPQHNACNAAGPHDQPS